MRRLPCLLLAAVAVCAVILPVQAQKFLPKTIQFKGDPEYSDQELMAAAGLKKGMVLDYAEMNAHSQQLLDTGMFATLAFKFDGQDLIFSLTPSTDLYPVRIDNLPLAPGTDLDARLRAMVPLYRGKVPGQDGLVESVRAALEKILAGQGVHASVTATASVNAATQKIKQMDYAIASPPVLVDPVGFDGVSPQFQPLVLAALKTAANLPFDTAHSADGLSSLVEQVYLDRGYAAVKVKAARSGPPQLSASGIQVPFSISVVEGRIYKLADIHLPEGAPLTPDEVSKMTSGASGPPQGVRIRSVWEALAMKYKAQGYLDCKITPQSHFDEAAGTVSYDVSIDPGPVYHMGLVKFDNVSDQLNAMLTHYWQLMPGDVFNQSYAANFIYRVQQQNPTLTNSLAGVKTSFDATADPHTHIVNLVIRLSK